MIDPSKKYRTANGKTAKVYATDGQGDYCVHGAILEVDGWNSVRWKADGSAINSGTTHPHDLIEVTEAYPITIQTATKWDKRFLGLAHHIGQWSKDPSTKVGAVIVNQDRSIVSLGYNGFARGVEDMQTRLIDRPTKYEFVVHAELNAILSASRSLHGRTLYVSPLHPCPACASAIVQSGISKVVAELDLSRDDWKARWVTASIILMEGGVETVLVSRENADV